jgi:cadmium resistance protein CadD (predicted permease)
VVHEFLHSGGSIVSLISLALVVFASTNIDDLFVLIGFFADKNYRTLDVIIGQFAGIGALYGISAIAALISLVVPPPFIGLLGVVPIAIGIKKLFWQKPTTGEPSIGIGRNGRRLAVAAVTIGNGGDNIAVNTAFLATRKLFEMPVVAIVFALLTALWCIAAHWLVNHRVLGLPIRTHANRIAPFVLIGLGILIFIKTGMLQF